MTFDAYQALARRTQNRDLTKHERRDHALCGLAAECGEIHGIYQKSYQGHKVETARVEEELGDLLWFCAELADVLGVSLNLVADANIQKLRRRYPDGFDEEHSIHREE
ncbi:MAG: nucleoside triphosphate pyrophosphohydrolase family protein [Oscillospiraceae bacterium]|nr:nucleoside triphosphate pyrophosphohydrolase family protein [Oscillospiraceae bacterium]